ncbi:MAG: Putative hemagglutinin/hemolysin-related protein [uncultured Sulfurovum sp.]|uniref:Hemagglutinin/hemolysin-related protein n=1 Tax=uncultured Sulfurovum sp. TaxID=269237 RepID=A0A6S6UH76_9BACT|nr:MAG: Putative hemagglutinin/hemolysin-related protein [uncultured Sulfurovum sp.]
MRTFKILLMLMVVFTLGYADVNNTSNIIKNTNIITTEHSLEPQTDDKVNPDLLNTLPAVNILNLSGVDYNGIEIECFRINTLPNSEAGILYLEDGETAITSGQFLTLKEANAMHFNPDENFEGNATFTYASVDSNELVDSTPATVTLPIVAPVVAPAMVDTENNESNVNSNINTDTDTTDHLIHDENCACQSYEESVPSVSTFGLLLMLLLSIWITHIHLKKGL